MRGLGTDIVEIERVREAVARHPTQFIQKIFTLAEQEYCQRYRDPIPHYAGRFAAKEAIAKALGTGFRNGLSLLDIEVVPDVHGKPIVQFSEKSLEWLKGGEILISISHCHEYATATALWI